MAISSLRADVHPVLASSEALINRASGRRIDIGGYTLAFCEAQGRCLPTSILNGIYNKTERIFPVKVMDELILKGLTSWSSFVMGDKDVTWENLEAKAEVEPDSILTTVVRNRLLLMDGIGGGETSLPRTYKDLVEKARTR